MTLVALLAAAVALACRGSEPAVADDGNVDGDGADVKGPGLSGIARADVVSDGWTVEPDDRGSVRIRHRHADVIRASYVFFGPSYAWADARIDDGRSAEGLREFELAIPDLGVTGRGTYRERGKSTLEVTWDLVAGRKLAGIVGGGLEFKVNLDPALFGGRTAKTELLDGGKGFALVVGDERMVVEFGGASAKVYFERGDPTTVRAFILPETMPAGKRTATMTITLPDGGIVRPAVADRYGADDPDAWPPTALESDDWPVDVSFLGDRPAGKHGRVVAKGDRLEFADGTPARFWGANVVAYALFDRDKRAIERQADRIAALGYNLVRLHHHDSAWVQPNVLDTKGGTTQALDDAALASVDWWVKCLTERGIYVWVDLHVGRQFLAGDEIPGFAELAKDQKGEAKGFNYVNPRIESLMQRFAEGYLGRANRFTKRTLADDPGVMGVLVTNENDVTHHFGQLFLPDHHNPTHQKLFEQRAKAFANEAGLPLPQALMTWEPGPAKIVMAELEHAFGRRAIAHLRKRGVKVPIATTSWWGAEGFYSLPSLLAGDIVDVHSYGDAEALSTNPRHQANFIAWIGAAQLVDRPLAITEWNVPPPVRDRFTAPLYVAAIGALQGWDAPMIYAYSQDGLGDPLEHPNNVTMWSSWNDPSLSALMPAAAVMFRRGDVAPAKQAYVLELGRKGTYEQRRTPDDSAAVRTLLEQSRLAIAVADVPELDWDSPGTRPKGAKVVRDLDEVFLAEGVTDIRADTGEIARDWVLGVQTIDTPRSQAAHGWLGGHPIELADVRIDVTTPKAAVAFTALDDAPIASSQRVLVTVVGRSHPGRGPTLPYRAEPIAGSIAIRSKHALELVPLSGRARATAKPNRDGLVATKPKKDGEWQVFEIPRKLSTHWFELRPAR